MDEADLLNMVTVVNRDTGETFTLGDVYSQISVGVGGLNLHDLELSPQKSSSAEDTERGEERLQFLRRMLAGRNKDFHELEASSSETICSGLRVKVAQKKKTCTEFNGMTLIQKFSCHAGSTWVIDFSPDGLYLATGGQDFLLRVWRLHRDVLNLTHVIDGVKDEQALIDPAPYRSFSGHRADVLDISWSTSNFLLSSSMDKTVRLWHVADANCLARFDHPDMVTAVHFHPRDDTVFLTGCFDEYLRLYKVTHAGTLDWTETRGIITSARFSNDGRLVLAGSHNGKLSIFDVDRLQFRTTLEVKSRRGKNSKGHKITGIDMVGDEKVLVTTSDSRIRLYNLSNYSESCKYKGFVNQDSLVKASLSPGCRYIISGSEDHRVYIWNTFNDKQKKGGIFSRSRSDRSDTYESFEAHEHTVTCAKFFPFKVEGTEDEREESSLGMLVVSADRRGEMRVWLNCATPENWTPP